MKDIAIIGFSGVFPDADSVHEFSENLLSKRCSIKEISKTRLFNTTISDENKYFQSGYLEEITLFDYNFFNISLGEAEEMTPHQRLILQEAYKTFENAGYRLKDLKGSNTSVYAANAPTNYYLLAKESTPTLIAGNTNAMLASRISRFFDLRGAAINVDTTCSSALTAISLACKDLILGETDLALVCGVNINVIPAEKDSKVVLGVEAKSEKCNTFSENADGTMQGEAVTGVLLKSLEQAEADGDIIYGVIKGFALNQDGGQSASIMAPSSEAQADVIRMALQKANLTPNDITFIEAHGTATKLGDPIEIEGIAQVFSPALDKDERVYVSAVKSNIGHTDGTAGLVGVIKVLLSFKNNVIYPSINALPLSSFIDFEKAKVAVVTEPMSWDAVQKATKKRAGVSSFGLMGTNAHFILESYDTRKFTAFEDSNREYTLCFSAKSEISLSKYLNSFKSYLNTTTDSLHDIAFTLNNCRALFQYRYIVKAESKKHLLEILENTTIEMILNSAESVQEHLILFDDTVTITDEILESLVSYSSYKDDLVTNAQKSLFVQYFSYQSLVQAGVSVKEMIGIGIGKIVLQVLKKEISLEEALKIVGNVQQDPTTETELQARALKLVSKYNNAIKIIGVGYQGRLGNIFDSLATDKVQYQVIGHLLPLSHNLETLFHLNFDVDANSYSENKSFSKVALPSYHFNEKRCWLRTTDNPFSRNASGVETEISTAPQEDLPIVAQLQKLWSETLKAEIQENDDFFDLGGHSLNGLQLINKINKNFSLDLNIDHLFDNGTPLEMAALIEEELKSNVKVPVKEVEAEETGVIKKAKQQELYDVSFAQKRLWLLAKMSDNTSSLNVGVSIVIDGKLDHANLDKAYQMVLERHESLRTSFVFADDQLKQKIHRFEEVANKIQHAEKEGLTKEALNDYILNLTEAPFDLESPNLIRATLIKLKENQHIINITLHHLICDGWSVTLFQKEFFNVYITLCAQLEVHWKPLQIQYKDYSAWQIEKSKEAVFTESESFWLTQFKESPRGLNLELQQNRPALKTYNGDVVTLKIPEALAVSIKALVKEEGITLAMFLGTILNLFLSKLSGESDITLGLPITNRNQSQLENQIGLYLNTLAIRSKFDTNTSFSDFLKVISNNFKSAYKHQHYPLELLLEKIQLQKDFSRSPLFDIVFTVQNHLNIDILEELDSLDTNNLKFRDFELNNFSGAQFDMFFRFIDTDGELAYELEYNTDLFTKETIYKYHHFLLNLVRQCVGNKEVNVKDLSLLSSADLEEINAKVSEFNATTVAYPSDKTVVDLFREQAKTTPNHVALKDDAKSYSYSELNIISDQIAGYLAATFTAEEKLPIAVLVGRSADMVALLLGILKSGRSYIPLDPSFPEDRLAYIIENSHSKTLVFEKEYKLKVSDDVAVLSLENILAGIGEYQDPAPIAVSPQDTAYIIYTSGSTGNPKGVEIGHQSLVNFLTSIQQRPGVTASDTLFSVTTYSFDISILEFFTPLISGAALYVASQDILSDPIVLITKIDAVQPTIIQATPSFYQMLFNAGWTGNKALKVLCGGDLLSEALAKKLIEATQEVWNMYGPTETTIWSSMKKVEVPKDASNIGKPLNNTQFYIVDELLRPKAIGVTGALYIAGDGLAKGYYRNALLTQEKFINNPFTENTLFYETGDLGKWNDKGEIEFLGRNDNQVKIRGYRIELGDIESAILQYSEVVKEVVVGVKGANQDKVLVAYLVSNVAIGKSELRSFLQDKLPDYMIPGFYLTMEALPLTPNGKIDRKALPEISEQDIVKKEYKAPRTEQEESLVAIWQEMLGVEKIGIADDFFELGGHSLIVAQVINRIHKQLGQTVSFTTFFEDPTIQGLSQRLQHNAYQAIPKAPEASSYPLTDSQSRLWILSQLEGGSLAYNMPAAVTLKGKLDAEKFKESFKQLIDRHEILRTSFKTNEAGEIRQYIIPSEQTNFAITEKDFSASANVQSTIADYLEEIINTPFDLEQAPLLNASLIKTKEEEAVFFLCVHHIIGDGWSTALLITEVVKVYNALTQGLAVNLPELNMQYKDYAVWLKDALQQEKYQVSEAYWIAQFQGELPVLDLPSFKTRPLVQTYSGDYQTHEFSSAFLEKLKLFSKQNDVTLFMTLMAGVNTLLHRYTGSDDIIIGTPIAGREHPDLENQMGLYLNTLAIRTHLEEKNSFSEVVNRQKETLLKAYDHQSYPFDALVGKLNLKRDTSRSALFDVLVVLQNQGQLHNLNNEGLLNLEVEGYPLERKTSQLDISFTFIETAGLELSIEYNTDIYDDYLIARMFIHFEILLDTLVAKPESLIAEVDYITPLEKQQLLFGFNETVFDYPKDKTIVDLFEEQVSKTPDHIAVVFENVELTYTQLNEKANQLAHYLRENYAIQPNDLVGIKLDRSEWMMIAILGILKSGAAYVPIDLNYPAERIAYIEQDSKSKVVLDEASVKAFAQIQETYAKKNIEKINQPHDLAYIIYTSGTTGNPKGVMVEHFSVASISENWKKHYELDQITVNLLQLASISFDVFVGDVCRSILNGGKMIICSNDVKLNPEHLFELMQKQEISILEGTPGLLLPLMDYIHTEKKEHSFLKIVIFGSDSFNNQDYNTLKDKFGSSIKIINSYGVTEATIDSTYYDDYKKDLNGFTPIGKPFCNSKIKIVDAYGNLVPTGVYGEIYIGGDGLARGYFNNEALTSEKFVPNPFNADEKLYRTGDLGRWFADGNIDFAGRKDNQVKIRGYRIELGEIESTLHKNKDIDSCVVLARVNSLGDKVLVAYLISGTVLNRENLIAYLQVYLPNYMIPSYFVQIEALPLTPNGKVDRKALPNPEESRISSGIEYVAPKTKAEKNIAAIWQEVLNVEKIGVNDNFFELGGHSLLLAQIINRIHKQLGQTVSFTAFFNSPTIAGLSTQLQSNTYLAIPKAEEAPSYPLTDSQSRLWILSQLEGGSLAYNMPAAVILKGSIDTEKFNESFQILIGRHEILRTRFRTNEEGDIRQYIIPVADTNFTVTQKDFSTAKDAETAIAAYLRTTMDTPFDLEQAPLVNASLVKAKENEYVFFLSLHHIIGDGWSIEVLISEVVKIYNALVQNRELNLPKLNIQFKDYAVWMNADLQQEKHKASEQYWLNQFNGELPVLDLPSFRTRPLVRTYQGDYVSHQFSVAFLEKVKAFSKEKDVTLFMTLMSGVNALLHRYSGMDDMIVGTPMSGREHPDLENQIGLYLNTLAVRTRLKEKGSFLDLLNVQKETLLEAYDHQNYPFDALVGKLNLKRDTSRSALFDVFVVLQNQGQLNSINTEELVNLEVKEYPFSRKVSQFDITFTFTEIAEGLELGIEYNTAIYDEYLIQRMFAHFENLLTQFTAQPQTLLSEADYLTEAEKQQLLLDFNDTAVTYPKEKTIVALFEEQVTRTPDHQALKDDQKAYSYLELDILSNQIAEYLIATYGQEDKSPIAVLLGRSADMVVFLLGILKSGRSYIPLDPTFPEERLAYIIENSQSKILIYEKEYTVASTSTIERVAVESIMEGIYQYDGAVSVTISPEDTAYIIFTSGSTGNPKGVEIGHQSLVNFLTSMQQKLKLEANDTLFSVTTYSFDISILEFFMPFLSGSTLYMASQDVIANPLLLIQKIEEVEPSIIQATPNFYQMLFNADWNGSKDLKVLCGGDLLSEALAEKLVAHNLEVWNMYGPTETTIWSSMKKIEQAKDASNIGQPINNTQLYILNEFLSPMPIGVSGALYIAGDGLAKGYYKKEELTKEKFIKNPFSDNSLLYETGDVGKWNDKGEIEFLGRNDSQVKLRGYRMELGDIETAIALYSDSIQQIVVAVKENNQEKVLVAYLVASSEIDKADLRAFLQKKLPDYMIPGFYVSLQELPLTSNGKIDRKALPAIAENDLIRREYEAPDNETEKKLVAVWQDILKIEKIGITDNFFELGGTSFQIIKLHKQIDLLWPQRLAISDLFEFNSIKEIALFINKNEEEKAREEETEEMRFFEI
ncbi:hypothetical protein B4N84_02115 [Flavobacterium sp. IR1]|nr:hypothetical protein B4N84_02115 [Flavobacterium sp. IR1]